MRSLVLVLVLAAARAAEFEQQVAAIGDLTTESGAVIRDCKLGYRTAGRLNAERGFGGAMERASAAVKARTMVVVARQDAVKQFLER